MQQYLGRPVLLVGEVMSSPVGSGQVRIHDVCTRVFHGVIDFDDNSKKDREIEQRIRSRICSIDFLCVIKSHFRDVECAILHQSRRNEYSKSMITISRFILIQATIKASDGMMITAFLPPGEVCEE